MLTTGEAERAAQLIFEVHHHLLDMHEATLQMDPERYSRARDGWNSAHDQLEALLPPMLEPLRAGERRFSADEALWMEAT